MRDWPSGCTARGRGDDGRGTGSQLAGSHLAARDEQLTQWTAKRWLMHGFYRQRLYSCTHRPDRRQPSRA
jgi:hypothetical protein